MTRRMLIFWLSAALLAAAPVSLAIGPTRLDLSALLSGDELMRTILFEIRLPRLLLALLIGGSLGLAGAALQGLFRNPLAEPGILGVSASAALGAVIALYHAAHGGGLPVPVAAMAGALAATGLLLFLSRHDVSLLSLILAGVGINALAGAATALALNLSPNPFALADMVHWLMGSLADRDLHDVALAAPFILAGCALILGSGPALSALTLGDEVARSLGVPLGRLRLRLVAGTALAVGAGVAVAGSIGFIGLIAPHLLRRASGHDPGALLLPSALLGALLLLLADSLARLLPGGQELKLGVVTALIGAPVFLHMVYRLGRERR